MVKRTLHVLAAALVAATGWGLGAGEGDVLASEVMEFPGIRPAPYASLLANGRNLSVVYADRDTTSLRALELPADGELPGAAPRDAFVDKVDTATPLGGSFGLHAAAAIDGRLRLLYLDREKDDRQLLKRVTQEAGGWRLELLEPFGAPIATSVGAGGKPLDVWAPGSLRLRDATGDRVLREPFAPRGQAATVIDGGAPAGFACWDDAANQLVVVRSGPNGLGCFAVPDASPVYAATGLPDGGLAVVTWDPRSRRILLLEHGAQGVLRRRTTVTICDGTNGLFLAPVDGGWLVVYDEVKPAPLGRWVWELAVLAPEPRTVGRPRYRRGLLTSGEEPITGFRTLIDGGALFVLEMRGGLRLLKVPRPWGSD